MMFQQPEPQASVKPRMSSAYMVNGSERASPRSNVAVVKTFQHLTSASTLGGPGSSRRIQAPEA
eukprot:3989624-Alexandrium_andersonii.AAC.1